MLTCLVAPATLHAGEEAVDEKVNAEKKMFERIEQLSARTSSFPAICNVWPK